MNLKLAIKVFIHILIMDEEKGINIYILEDEEVSEYINIKKEFPIWYKGENINEMY